MSHKLNDHDKNNFSKDADSGTQNERRIDQLVDIVEKHTRTERHLEQHSDIASPEQVSHSKEIQREREDEIDNLKNIIAHGKSGSVDELAHLERNYEFTNNYIEENSDHMDSETLENTKQKQENRKNQLNNFNK